MPRTYVPKAPLATHCRWCGVDLPARRRSDKLFCDDTCRDAERNERNQRLKARGPGQTTIDPDIPSVSSLQQAHIPGMPRELSRERTLSDVGMSAESREPFQRVGGPAYSIRALISRLGRSGAREAVASLPLDQQVELIAVSEDARLLYLDIVTSLPGYAESRVTEADLTRTA